MSQSYLAIHTLGDMVVRFPHDKISGRVGLEIIPGAAMTHVVPRRETLRGLVHIDAIPFNDPWPAYVVESLVQFKLVGDPYPGAFVQGHSLRQSGSVAQFKSVEQDVLNESGRVIIVTKLAQADGCWVEHRLSHREGDHTFEISSSFTNGSARAVTLEMLSSFSFSGLTPFAPDDARGRLRVHRFRSAWSAEGRLETRSIEELHLERSWTGVAAFSERFGQLGTMPVRKWFPFVALEDTAAGVVWGAQLAWAGSWQMEIFRQNDDVALSGGLADREFGHWTKTLQPGEMLEAPPAVISCVQGSLDDLCDRLTAMQQRAADAQPVVERDLPIVMNEWCTTWGDPSHENISAIADRLQGSEVRYLVIDAGWYKGEASDWSSGHGDWIPSPKLFPNGLEATARAVRDRGLTPGLWFEMEDVGSQSTAFSLVDHMLQRDGLPITVRERRFWNLNDPWAVDYLTKKVIDLLERCDFGYLKVDYNETAGIGCDHPDSLGEGLRLQIEGQYRFFDKIRQRLPDLVVENCSSGGHRLEPSMIGRTAMSVFSDAHELVEIPIIAANLHRLMLPRQSQVWAVLHQADSDQRLAYSLAATFLGRMCLSGEIAGLAPAQWQMVRRAMKLYRQVAPILKHGTSRRFGELDAKLASSSGLASDGANIRRPAAGARGFTPSPIRPKQVEIPLPAGSWRVTQEFPNAAVRVAGQALSCPGESDFCGRVTLLEK